MATYTLSPKISYQTLPGMAALLDHASHEVHTLNLEAGRLLARLDRGEPPADEDEGEFAEQLVELGIAARAGDPFTEPQGADDSGKGDDDDDESPLAELNAHAAEHLVPLHLQLELTHRCPLSCRHCYLGGACGRGEAADELTSAEIVTLLDSARALGSLFLVLTGGEPLLRPDLEQVVLAARDRRLAVSLNTSGWGHDPAMLGRLAGRGLDTVQVSLYGPDAASHDAMTRMDGSFQQALGCLRAARDLGVRALAAVTPTTMAPPDAPARLADRLGREGLGAVLGLYMQPRRDGDASPQEMTLDADGLRRVLGSFSPGAAPRMARICAGDRPCGAGANTVSVDPTGGIYPCLPLRLRLGSIREQPLEEIWSDSPDLARLRGLTLADLEQCAGCELRFHCNRCAGFALAEGKGLTGHSGFDCLMAEVLSKQEQQ